MMQTGHGGRFGPLAASRWSRTSGAFSKAASRRARHRVLVRASHRRTEPRVSVVGTMQARRHRLRHGSPRPLFHDRSVLRGLTGLALGLGLSLSCGGNKGGGGGTGGCRNTADLCENCLPGQSVYTCAISSPNNWICSFDDVTADQPCAAIGAVVQSKTECVPEPATGGNPPPGQDGDGTGTPDTADDGTVGESKRQGGGD